MPYSPDNEYNWLVKYRQIKKQDLLGLEVLHRELTEKRQAGRVKAIILLSAGWTPTQVAQAVFIDRSTVRRYYRDYISLHISYMLRQYFLFPPRLV